MYGKMFSCWNMNLLVLQYNYVIIFLNSLLPAPTQPVWDRDEERAKVRVHASSLVVASPTAPPYGQRRGWVPRSLEV